MGASQFQQSSRGGVRHPPGAALDVRVLGFGAAGRVQVTLKAGAVLAEVVPQPGQMCRRGTLEGAGVSRGPLSYLDKVVFQRMQSQVVTRLDGMGSSGTGGRSVFHVGTSGAGTGPVSALMMDTGSLES